MSHEYRLQIPRPHAGQKLILENARRYNIVSCGRRFGKTTLGGNLLAPILIGEGKHCAWFAPTYRLLEEANFSHRKMFEPFIAKAVTAPSLRIELKNGSVIDYWSLNDPKTVARGRKYKRVIIDEAAMTPYLEEAWNQAIRPTLTDWIGDAYFLSTPKGRNYFAELFDRAGDENEPDWARWQMPTTANPFISPSEVDEARRSIPSIAFMQEYLAEFVDGQGARIKREWLKFSECPTGLDVYLGVDLAISTKQDADYSAIVAMSRDADGNIYVRDVQRIRATFHDVIQFVIAMADKWKPRMIGIETVQYQAAVIQELLRTTRLPIRGIRPDKDKVTRFAPLEARYEQGFVYHDHRLLREFQDELLSFPIGANDDMVDACAYAFMMLGNVRSWGVV